MANAINSNIFSTLSYDNHENNPDSIVVKVSIYFITNTYTNTNYKGYKGYNNDDRSLSTYI